jgi:hypothetical protein
MATAATVSQRDESVLITNPWLLLASGMITIAGGTLSSVALKDAAPWLTVLLISVGALLTSGAVLVRCQSAVVWGLAALGASVGSVGFQELGWDSVQLLFLVLMAAAGVGALIVMLPTAARWVVISVLIVIHFGGILTAVCSAAPGTWVASTLWNFFYRPHLQFMYLNNAYHYYAPEPGPATLIWFCIHYEPNSDGSPNWRWVKVPNFDAQGRPLRPDGHRLWPNTEYTRRLNLAEYMSFSGFQDDSGPSSLEDKIGALRQGYRSISLCTTKCGSSRSTSRQTRWPCAGPKPPSATSRVPIPMRGNPNWR